MIKAEIIADSINPGGNRITTYILTYPRMIHSEIMTHRLFSRNAASSRAIPIQKMIEAIEREPAMPAYWGKNQSGMQAAEELDDKSKKLAVIHWHSAMNEAIAHCKALMAVGVHKQIANRLLEPFAHMTTLVTATDYGNFFALRAHKDAQPEFQVLAYRMLGLYLSSQPEKNDWGQWHIPFGDKMPEDAPIETKLKIAVARAARVSYKTFDGEMDVEKDLAICEKLSSAGHWSPFEHVAQADSRASLHRSNFNGWTQYRKSFFGEHREHPHLHGIWDARPDRVGSEKLR